MSADTDASIDMFSILACAENHSGSDYDALTGLMSIRSFYAALRRAVAAADATPSGPRVLVTTVKMIRFGSLIASLDETELALVLRAAAHRIKAVAGRLAPISRAASGTFVACLESERQAEAIIQAFHQPLTIGGNILFLPVSVGIARHPDHGDRPEILVKAAWLAAHEGRFGESRCYSYHPDIGTRLGRRRVIEHALRCAIATLEAGESDPFELVYQPKIDLATHTVSGVEALVRWNDETIGAGPGEFIAIAEETGLIVPLGRWIVSRALAHYQAWRACGHELKLAINVSPAQLASGEAPCFADFLAGELAASGVAPASIEVEITEGIMADQAARAAIDQLSQSGVRIAVDDFGKYHSNLAILSTIPASTLKIDKEFVDDILGDDRKRIIAQQVVTLARALGMRSVMEGVETREQLDLLATLGCDEVQGYVFSRPVKPECVPLIQAHVTAHRHTRGPMPPMRPILGVSAKQ